MSLVAETDAVDNQSFDNPDLIRAHRAAVTFAILFVAAYFLPSVLRPNVYTDDMSEWTSWAYSFQDPDLFHNDIIKTYWMSNFPLGYKSIFEALSPLADTELVGKLLGLILGAVATVLGYNLGRAVTGKVSGGIVNLVMVPLCQVSPFGPISFLNREAGGLPRSFALPIMLLGVTGAFKRDMRTLGLSLIAAALFYPPAFVMLGTYAGLLVMIGVVRSRRLPNGFSVLLLTGAAGMGIVLASGLSSRAITGPLYTFEQMRRMPEFFGKGIAGYFFHDHWWDYLFEIFQFDNGVASVLWLSLIIATFAFGARDQRTLRKEMILIPISAFVNYCLAYLLLLRMFEPSRYLLFPLQVLTICCVPLLFEHLFGRAVQDLGRNAGWRRSSRYVWMMGPAAIAALGLAVFATRVVLDRGGLDPLPPELYGFLRELPKNALIAATPTDGDRVPMRSRRSALLIKASLFPYHSVYYEEMKRRFGAVLQTRYDPSPDAVQNLRRTYGVRYFIYDNNRSRQDPFAELHPYDRDVARLSAALGDKQSYLSGISKDSAIFRIGDYSVLDLDRLGPVP